MAASRPPEIPLSASIACVLRRKSPPVLALDHVVHLLDELLDISESFSLERAAANGSVRLFDRVYDRVVMTARPPIEPCVVVFKLGKAMKNAVSNGHLAIVKRVHALHPQQLPVRVLPVAAANGDLPMLKCLLEHRKNEFCRSSSEDAESFTFADLIATSKCWYINEASRRVLDEPYKCAVENKHLHVVRWLLSIGYRDYTIFKDDTKAGDVAASMGDLEMVQWLHTEQIPESFSVQAIDDACLGGHLAVVEYLLANRLEGFTTAAVNHAVVGGYNKLYQLLRGSQVLKDDAFSDLSCWAPQVASQGRLDLLQSDQYAMREPNDQYQHSAMKMACESGHLHVVKWLIDHYRIKCNPDAVALAARNGHVDILEWVHAQACGDWHQWAMCCATGAHQHGVVEWLYANRPDEFPRPLPPPRSTQR